jgi:hypothetical protein
MLWGAPLCFVLQARPVKLWSKILFYMISNPPGIVSSLLPAPQQAILNADIEASYAALYRPDEEEREKATVATKKGMRMGESKEEIVDEDVDASDTEEEEDESEEEEDEEETE